MFWQFGENNGQNRRRSVFLTTWHCILSAEGSPYKAIEELAEFVM